MKRVLFAIVLASLPFRVPADPVVQSMDFNVGATDTATFPDSTFTQNELVIPLDPALPGYIVDDLRVLVSIESAYATVDTTSGLAVADVLMGAYFTGGSLTEFPPNSTFINDTIAIEQTVVFPTPVEGQSYILPHNIFFDFAPGNVPDQLQLYVRTFARGEVLSTLGVAETRMRGTVYITYNPEPTTLVKLLDVTGLTEGGEPYTTAQEVSTVEVPESTLDSGDFIGVADMVEGTVTVRRDGVGPMLPVSIGTLFFEDDVIETFENSSIQILFIDDTTFAINEDSRIAIDEYVYDSVRNPNESEFSILKGVFVFTSGLIGKEDKHVDEGVQGVGSIGFRGRHGSPTGPLTQEIGRFLGVQASPYTIGFDYALLEPDMTLEVLIDNISVGTYTRGPGTPDPAGLSRETLTIDSINALTLGPVNLRFRVTGPEGAEFLIDNVTGPGFLDPGFDTGLGPWYSRGDGEVALAAVIFDELCLGSGDYDAGQLMATPATPLAVERADMNLDGIPDVIVWSGPKFGDPDPTVISVMIGNGDGTFAAPVEYVLEAPISEFEVFDVTGDAFPDVVFVSSSAADPAPTSYDDGLNVMSNDGTGTLNAPTTIVPDPPLPPGSSSINEFAIADADGDQRVDLIYYPGSGLQLQAWLGQPGGGFVASGTTLSLDFQPVEDMLTCDVNADGHADVVVAYVTGGIEVLLNDGAGVFSRGTGIATTGYIAELLVDDFNGDAVYDLIVNHERMDPDAIEVFLGDGAGGFSYSAAYVGSLPSGSRVNDVQSGDIDNDGDRDLVVMANRFNSITRLINDGTGVFTEEAVGGSTASSRLYGEGFVLIDADRNGSLDVVGDDGFSNTVTVFESVCRPDCVVDLDGNGSLNLDDIDLFVAAFLTGDLLVDFDGNGALNLDDLDLFVAGFLAGC